MNKTVKLAAIVLTAGLVAVSTTGAATTITASVATPPASYHTPRFPVGPAPNPDAGH